MPGLPSLPTSLIGSSASVSNTTTSTIEYLLFVFHYVNKTANDNQCYYVAGVAVTSKNSANVEIKIDDKNTLTLQFLNPYPSDGSSDNFQAVSLTSKEGAASDWEILNKVLDAEFKDGFFKRLFGNDDGKRLSLSKYLYTHITPNDSYNFMKYLCINQDGSSLSVGDDFIQVESYIIYYKYNGGVFKNSKEFLDDMTKDTNTSIRRIDNFKIEMSDMKPDISVDGISKSNKLFPSNISIIVKSEHKRDMKQSSKDGLNTSLLEKKNISKSTIGELGSGYKTGKRGRGKVTFH